MPCLGRLHEPVHHREDLQPRQSAILDDRLDHHPQVFERSVELDADQRRVGRQPTERRAGRGRVLARRKSPIEGDPEPVALVGQVDPHDRQLLAAGVLILPRYERDKDRPRLHVEVMPHPFLGQKIRAARETDWHGALLAKGMTWPWPC